MRGFYNDTHFLPSETFRDGDGGVRFCDSVPSTDNINGLINPPVCAQSNVSRATCGTRKKSRFYKKNLKKKIGIVSDVKRDSDYLPFLIVSIYIFVIS